MTSRTIHPRLRLAAAAFAVVLLGATAWITPASAAPTESSAALATPAVNALTWLTNELDANGDAMPSTLGGNDWGLTIDALLALAGGQQGGSATAVATTGNLMTNVANEYFTGTSFGSPDDRYAGPLAKTLLIAEVQGVDTTNVGGFDLETTLRSLMQTTGDQAGRFSDVSSFGDFSNGFGQALAVMALARTTGGDPSAALSFLLAQQCPAGGFRLFYASTTSDPAGCTADAEADTDGTSFAIEALVAAPHTPVTVAAAGRALTWLDGQQGNDGGVMGSGPTAAENANSSGLAATAFRAGGDTDRAAAAEAWVESVQLTETDPNVSPAAADAGAIALNPGAHDTAVADGIDANSRDQFRRSTAQGALALGLDGYDTVGGYTPSTAAATATSTASTSSAGDTITVTGSGFLTDEPVTAVLHSDPVTIGTKTASAGAVSFAITLPSDLDAGQHTVAMTGGVSGLVADVTIEVEAPTAVTPIDDTTDGTTGSGEQTTSDTGLARTGASTTGPLALAAFFLTLGAAALVAAERRKRTLRSG